MNRKYRIYKKILTGCVWVTLCILFIFLYFDISDKMPSSLRLFHHTEQELNFHLPVTGELYVVPQEQTVVEQTSDPLAETAAKEESNIPKQSIHIDLAKNVTLYSEKSGKYRMDLKILGIIPVKNVDITVVPKEKVIPGGIPIGIYMKTKGVLVVGTGPVKDSEGIEQEPARYLLRSGDYIESINNTPIEGKKELIQCILEEGDQELYLGIRRNEEHLTVKVHAVECVPGDYKIGIWVRDNTQGIGTLTYLGENGKFGALGHGINDIDTAGLMELYEGALYQTKIVSVIRGTRGVPGELTGSINYRKENVIGEITRNTCGGIFGNADTRLCKELKEQQEPVEIGLKQDITTGPAVIYSAIDGTRRKYDIEIMDVDYSPATLNKGIVFKVTDRELLEKTGGIVQGMSGSPILQNEKMIGAVTHVFVNDPTRGYGIFIETMLEQE